MNKTIAKLFASSCIVAVGVICPSASADTAPISVVVNQVPVVFSGAQPMEIGNSAFVPLRGVFEQLGATVQYDPSTRQIVSQRGNAIVTLTLGNSQAFVNGFLQSLPEPPQVINGTTMIPLRFVAEAFGADVAWSQQAMTVAITTNDQHLSQLPSPSLNREGNVFGTLTGIFQSTNQPKITLRVAGENTAVPIDANTIVTMQAESGPAQQSAVDQLRIGQQIRVSEPSVGATATAISVRYGELVGEVKSIGTLPDGNPVITLTDGQTGEISPGASFRMAGRAIALKDISVADHVTIRVDPQTNLAYEVSVHTQGG